jgi:hypothetical protein
VKEQVHLGRANTQMLELDPVDEGRKTRADHPQTPRVQPIEALRVE